MSDEKACISCKKKCTKGNFSKRQWRLKDPSCLSCSELKCSTSDVQQAKIACIQCRKNFDRKGFSKLQLRQTEPLCRFCEEFTKISKDMSRQCHDCKVSLPRIQFDIQQWGRSDEALCHCCRDLLQKKHLDSIFDSDGTEHKVLSDDTCVCVAHSLECCDICMMDFTLPNQFALKRKALGRDLLTDDETNEIIKKTQKGMRINKKICIMDGQSICPRLPGSKLRCACGEVTYCSLACQKYHWTIHSMTCKSKVKKDKQNKVSKVATPTAQIAHDLTEEQLDYIFVETFLAENNGGEHSIAECAWQLGVHPALILGGSVTYHAGGNTKFTKGDVAKIYRDAGHQWDGSPRFGLSAYKQQKTHVDWIAKAHQGKSQRQKKFEKDFEKELRRR